jgi:biopolymer transport protein ExbD
MSKHSHSGMQTMFMHKKKKRGNEEMALQITSMADIFTIILVFLLKTTASGINTVAPNGANLPVMAHGKEIVADTLKMEINRDMITIDDKVVLNLQQFELPVTEVQEGGMSQSVYKAFAEKRKPGAGQETNANSTLLVLADENVPYATLKSALASAANTGFVDLQLVVVEDN